MNPFIGKRLLLKETGLSADEMNLLEEKGEVKIESGFLHERGRLTCRRCGTSDRSLFGDHLCAKCGKNCTYCRHCLLLGKVSECESLYHWKGTDASFPKKKESLMWKGKLSSGQEEASKAVIDAIENKEELLVWAVAGAGKTELLFPGLERAFSKGWRVLLATPRVDVVKELTPRLRQSFPKIQIASLYGGSRDHHISAQLVIATTHQVMRYYHAFDVVIIDEVDAFPYSIDRSLTYAVTNAKKQLSSTIYLTATPNNSLLKSKIKIVKIPKRYHGFPLPEPEFKWCGNWLKAVKRNQLPKNLHSWIKNHLHKQNPLLLFVPTIPAMQLLSTTLTEQSIHHLSVHASDPRRHEAVDSFRNGRIPILLSTTILERGVTFSNVQIGIIGAEHHVFSEAALIQMAGRAGRAREFPYGEVIFYHYGISTAMRAAKRHIKKMNKEGETSETLPQLPSAFK